MNTLSTLFLHSSRAYSAFADAIFGDSVEQSQFASTVSSRRMETAKVIASTALDIQIDLDDEDISILTSEIDWQVCLTLDNILMRIMSEDETQFLPLLTGVFVAAHQGVVYASQANDRPEHKLCLGCGSISEQWTCPVCGNERNWLTGVQVPVNRETPEIIVDATEEVSLPNLSFADFPPERPVQPQKWEVLFDNGRKDDIFAATGLARPRMGDSSLSSK